MYAAHCESISPVAVQMDQTTGGKKQLSRQPLEKKKKNVFLQVQATDNVPFFPPGVCVPQKKQHIYTRSDQKVSCVGETTATGARTRRPRLLPVLTDQRRAARLVFARERQSWQICQRRPVLVTVEGRLPLTTRDGFERVAETAWRTFYCAICNLGSSLLSLSLILNPVLSVRMIYWTSVQITF